MRDPIQYVILVNNVTSIIPEDIGSRKNVQKLYLLKQPFGVWSVVDSLLSIQTCLVSKDGRKGFCVVFSNQLDLLLLKIIRQSFWMQL
jgi:hypothetical protein